jgi:transcriptional regulator with XRE-family HTH domain
MSRHRRRALVSEARRRTREQLARLGGELRRSRLRRKLTQAHLADIVDVTQSTISDMERGVGMGLSIDVWQRVFIALDRPLIVEAGRDPREDVADAGHLALQELVLRPRIGLHGSFELPTRPANPRRSVDVLLRDDLRRLLIISECWNTFGDIGASVRPTNRKVAEAEDLAVAFGGERPYEVRACWVVRDTARNRTLLATHPAIFDRAFPGTSVGGSKR